MEGPRSSPTTSVELTGKAENQVHQILIESKRILKLNASVKNFKFNSKHDDLSILHIDECKYLEDANEVIQNLDFQNAPNIFVIVIDTKSENTKSIEKLQEEIIKKFNEMERDFWVLGAEREKITAKITVKKNRKY